MTKVSRSFSIDEDLNRELTERSDINPSAAVNEFLRRLLAGETTDQATKRLEIERKRELAEEKAREATTLEEEARQLEEELRNQRRDKRETLKEVAASLPVAEIKGSDTPVVDVSEDELTRIAQGAGVPPERLREAAVKQHEREKGSRGYQ